jgi:hypothetical protein
MNGYHIYYEFSDGKDNYEYLTFLSHLCSILFWKKNFGNINLICNQEFLEKIKYWELDKYYDNIDTKLFKVIPHSNKLEVFWSFPKIYGIKYISNFEDEFCVLDTDLWIYDSISFDKKCELVGYHKELINDSENNPYKDPKKWIQNDDLDWTTSPLNCAFLYFNSKKLIDYWYSKAFNIISDFNSAMSENSADTVFIEQRLLPTICKKLNMNYTTLIENVYNPDSEKDGSEWIPQIGYTEENEKKFMNIKHVWGLKKMFSDIDIRNMVSYTCKNSLDYYFPGWELNNEKIFNHLIDDMKESFI